MYFDELDSFLIRFKAREVRREDEDDIIDEILDLYILGYLDGSQEAARELGIETRPSVEEMMDTIEKPVAGKTFRQRISEYLNGEGDVSPKDGIARVVDTDATRIYNTAILETGIKNGATQKTWVTMADDRVRETHDWLEGMTVPIDSYFYTGGDKALAPGGFENPENNVNCRCVLKIS